MRDITINSEESQSENTKNTPVERTETNKKEAINSLPNVIINSWLGMRDSNPRYWNQNPVPYHLANPH